MNPKSANLGTLGTTVGTLEMQSICGAGSVGWDGFSYVAKPSSSLNRLRLIHRRGASPEIAFPRRAAEPQPKRK